MSSFELKPLSRVGIGSKVENIVWTAPRQPLPVLLENRVSLSTWQATFDAVVERYESLLGSFKCWMLIPCFVCCSMPRMVSISREHQASWTNLAQEQNEIYRSFGIQVSIAREIVGSDSHIQNAIVGLKFDIGHNGTHVLSQTKTNPEIGTGGGGGVSISDDLEKLARLRAAGELSDAEYSAAKANLLGL